MTDQLQHLEGINSGIEYDQQRAPEGYSFLSNLSLKADEEILRDYRNNDDFVIMDTAFTADGKLIKGNVAVFRKKTDGTS